MFPWLWIWAPQVQFPWSGDVAQRIEPDTRWFFGGIAPAAGVAEVERKAFEVASYGRQLGLITEVLLEMAQREAPATAAARESLRRLREIHARIERIKDDDVAASAQLIAEQAQRLRQRSPAQFEALVARLGLPAPGDPA